MTGLAPEIPEDLYMLIKKVASTSLRSHSLYLSLVEGGKTKR